MSDRADWSEIETEAARLLALSGQAGLTMRVVGSTGIRMHCSASAEVMDRLGRGPKDLDLVCRGRDRRRLLRLLEGEGYELDRDVLVAMEGTRFCLSHPGSRVELDLFVDRLQFCHTIELADRLERHSPTVPIEDLLLQKLQPHEPVPSDIADATTLLSTHPVDESSRDAERIDSAYIAGLLARDWGFHRTATDNLRTISARLGNGALETLEPRVADTARTRVGALLEAIEAAPKSMRWRTRARVGDRLQWWQDVSEREATY